MDHGRPDPDALLRRVQEEEARARRGQLKIFLGASPGVGKDLHHARGRPCHSAPRGSTSPSGVVETHGRQETARLLDGLEILPRRPVEYRGTTPR